MHALGLITIHSVLYSTRSLCLRQVVEDMLFFEHSSKQPFVTRLAILTYEQLLLRPRF